MAPAQETTARASPVGLGLPHLGDAYSLAALDHRNRADAEDVVQTLACAQFEPSAALGTKRTPMGADRRAQYRLYMAAEDRPSAVLAVENSRRCRDANAKPGDPDSENP